MTRDDIIRMAEEASGGRAQPESAECDGGQCGIGGYCKQCPKTQPENEFAPDWNAMAVMVEEQQRMSKRIEELEAALAQPEQEPAWIKTRKITYMNFTEPQQQPEQEPVAYLCENAVGHKYFRWKKPSSEYKPIALYTAHASPQRIWQGLTDEEIKDHWITCMWKIEGTALPIPEFALAIEAKLKEKNT